MGTFIESSKKLVLKNCSSSTVLQLDNSVTLQFYIVERNNNTLLSSIDFQVEKVAGRTYTVLSAWAPVTITGVTDGIYTIEYTLASATALVTDKLLLKFKVIDEDGIEYFIELNDFSITA